MLEWAIAPGALGDLRLLCERGAIVAGPSGLTAFSRQIEREVHFTRLYWGDSFCHHLLPTPAERQEALQLRDDHALALTLATPPLSEPELPHLREVLGWLEPGEEVEVNDFGALRIVAREFGHLVPVLGRALLRALKDPRREGGNRLAAVPPALARVLERHAVTLVTADGPVDPGALDLALTLPHRFVSSGRICLIGSTSLPTARRFSVGAPCRRECRDFMLDLRTVEWGLVQRGNTVYAPWGADDWSAFEGAVAAGRLRRAVYLAGVDAELRFLTGGDSRPAMIPLEVLP